MRYAVLVSFCFTCVVGGQELKHMMGVTANGVRPSTLTAFEIERVGDYPAVIHLKGAVEIKSPVCLPVGKRGKLICDGEMILRADEATFHEDSGQIEAQGVVTLTPLHHAAK
jgi:hypothetical protein